jgi:hypothetical protein
MTFLPHLADQLVLISIAIPALVACLMSLIYLLM